MGLQILLLAFATCTPISAVLLSCSVSAFPVFGLLSCPKSEFSSEVGGELFLHTTKPAETQIHRNRKHIFTHLHINKKCVVKEIANQSNREKEGVLFLGVASKMHLL